MNDKDLINLLRTSKKAKAFFDAICQDCDQEWFIGNDDLKKWSIDNLPELCRFVAMTEKIVKEQTQS